MEHKKRFILITTILMAAILGTIGMAVALMLETYRSLNNDFAEAVQSALDDAIALEQKISGAAQLDIRTLAAGQPFQWGALENIPINEISSVTVNKAGKAGTGTVSLFFNADSSRTEKRAGRVNVPVLRSFLDELFRSRGIGGAYSLQVVRRAVEHRFIPMGDAASGSVASVRVAGAGGDTTVISYGRADSLSAPASAPDTLYDDRLAIAHAREFRAEVGNGTQAECRLLIESPHRMLWGKLAGVVAASVLIALVLCFSFGYLLRTLLKMKSLGEMRRDFTHNITHELKTPIAAISATNEALTDFAVGDDPDRRQKYLAVQRHYLQSLSSMVERILALSVQESEDFRLRPEPCSLSALIAEEVRTLPLKYKKPIQIRTELPAGDCEVRVDRFHFANVLLNILDNAVKYGGDEPCITVRVERTNAGRTSISISDNGPGIPPSQRKRIFEKYYRIPSGDVQNVRGYGIGLYYCRLVVEKSGGRISVSDPPGGGAVFTIIL